MLAGEAPGYSHESPPSLRCIAADPSERLHCEIEQIDVTTTGAFIGVLAARSAPDPQSCIADMAWVLCAWVLCGMEPRR